MNFGNVNKPAQLRTNLHKLQQYDTTFTEHQPRRFH